MLLPIFQTTEILLKFVTLNKATHQTRIKNTWLHETCSEYQLITFDL